ncbi:MAG: SufE family protein [Paludibacteraceae bacterium]|nr:SufE family protein [Paludibacteraceae bacterium]MBR1787498.1 SufE family protein [Paludibacteraceae bacterium]
MSINEIQDSIIEEFEQFDDWFDRYNLLIEYGHSLPAFPEQDKNDTNKIEGCQSSVWFTAHLNDGRIHFEGDSDALLVKGMVAMLLKVLSDQTPEDILSADLYMIDRIGLREHLSPTRSNGLLAMLRQMRSYALAFSALQQVENKK